jgi:hypothetical protein
MYFAVFSVLALAAAYSVLVTNHAAPVAILLAASLVGILLFAHSPKELTFDVRSSLSAAGKPSVPAAAIPLATTRYLAAPVTGGLVDTWEFMPLLVAELRGDILFHAILALVLTQLALYTSMV